MFAAASAWMKLMAVRIAQQGGARQTSHFLWTTIYESTRDPEIRKKALEHLRALKAEEEEENLEGWLRKSCSDAGNRPNRR